MSETEKQMPESGVVARHEDVNLEVVYEVPLQISAVLGKAVMKISELVKLARGSVVELDKKVGDAVEVFVNDKLMAKGEIVLIDNKIGITITELVRKDGA
jgi:flagellar motor switch protein FliN/FliY